MIGQVPDCLVCKHFNELEYGLTCNAFPDGIPENIIMGEPHTKPLPSQGNDIVFEEDK